MATLIADVTLIDGVSDRPANEQSILIEGSRIKAVGPRSRFGPEDYSDVIEGRGKFVIPGLMDANVHLMGDIRLEQLIRYEDRYQEVITEAAQIALRSGVTTVFDTWGPRVHLCAVRDRINSGAIVASRIFCAGTIVGLDGPISADFVPKSLEVASPSYARRINSLYAENVGPDLTWMTPEQVAEEVRAYIKTGIDFVKYAANEHRGSEPNAFLMFSPAVQEMIIREAHEAGMTAQAHATSVEGLRVAVEAGCDIIQHGNLSGPVRLPDSTLKLMARREIAVAVFPLTDRRLDFMQKNFDVYARRFFSTADANCRALIESGVTLMLGTDGAIQESEPASGGVAANPIGTGDDNLFELGQGHFHWLKAMEEKGGDPMAMLRAATCNVAKAYRLDHLYGTIESGKVADLLILDKNPLDAAENYRAIDAVIKEGRIVDTKALPNPPLLTKIAIATSGDAQRYGRFSASRYPSCCGSW